VAVARARAGAATAVRESFPIEDFPEHIELPPRPRPDAQDRADDRPGDPALEQTLKRIPARRGVALLEGPAGEAVQLLAAADLRRGVLNRLRERPVEADTRLPDLLAVTAGVRWALVGGPFEQDRLYLEHAIRLFPRRFASMVSWKPAWFVHVDLDEPLPSPRAVREVFGRAGRYFGPLPHGRAARRCVEALQDAYGLCREAQCLCDAPHASRCTWGQMGRCLCPCDGTCSPEDYRAAVAEAVEVLGGDLQGRLDAMAARMAESAAKLDFEAAAATKRSLQALETLLGAEFAFLQPAEALKMMILAPGLSRQEARLFLVNGPRIEGPRSLRYPPDGRQLDAALRRMRGLAERGAGPDRPGPEDKSRLGLAVRALFSEDRRHRCLPWREDFSAECLAGEIESAAKDLGLRPPRRRGRGGADASANG
jgi:excinuclease UvrABC nuclease subunit